MALQNTPNKGNGSVIDLQSLQQSMDPLSQRDTFQENLERSAKPVQDNILQYPLDLFKTPEYCYGIQFDIFDTSGDVITEDRKVMRGVDNLVNQMAANAQTIRQSLNSDSGLAAEATAVVSALGSATTSLAAFGANYASSFIEFGTTVEKKWDPSDQESQVQAIVGVKSPQKKVASIWMYLPGNLSFSSGLDYEDADMTGIDFIRGILGGFGAGNPEAQADIIRKLGLGAISGSGLGDALGGADLVKNFAKIQQKQVENPFLIHLFKGVQRRTFTFDFTMVPRSLQEAKNIYSIVQTFRRYAHPKRNQSGRFLDFPAEFGLTFVYKAEGKKTPIAIPKVKRCAITSIKVDYGENIFAAHRTDEMVMPTTVKMSIGLSELSILARQEIEDGY
jgi:hypothetical protein